MSLARAGWKKGLKGKRRIKKKSKEKFFSMCSAFCRLCLCLSYTLGWENKMRYFCELYEVCIVRHYTKDTHPHTHYMYIKKSISPPPPSFFASCENSKTKQHTSWFGKGASEWVRNCKVNVGWKATSNRVKWWADALSISEILQSLVLRTWAFLGCHSSTRRDGVPWIAFAILLLWLGNNSKKICASPKKSSQCTMKRVATLRCEFL